MSPTTLFRARAVRRLTADADADALRLGPFRRPWRGIPFVAQTEISDCGAACLAMTLAHHGRRLPLRDVRERVGTARGGVSALALVRAAWLPTCWSSATVATSWDSGWRNPAASAASASIVPSPRCPPSTRWAPSSRTASGAPSTSAPRSASIRAWSAPFSRPTFSSST